MLRCPDCGQTSRAIWLGSEIGQENLYLQFKKKAVLNVHNQQPVPLETLLEATDVKMLCIFCRNKKHNAAAWRQARQQPMSDWDVEEDLGQIVDPFVMEPEDVETLEDLDLLPDDDEYGGDDDGE